jgi:hypothetical protein
VTKQFCALWIAAQLESWAMPGSFPSQAVAELRRLHEVNAELLEALKWMVENDETNEGDDPVESLGGASWNEYNDYWISGLNKAKAAISKATGETE